MYDLVAGRVLRKLFLPAPLDAAYTVLRSLHFLWKGVLDLGLADSVVVVQVGFQHVGPVQRHPHVADVYPQTAAAFMKNSTFHI